MTERAAHLVDHVLPADVPVRLSALRPAGAGARAVADDASVTPRGGLAAGEVLMRGGDYYGTVVNLAPACVSAAECDDGDPCTADDCVGGTCVATLPPTYAAVSCEAGRLALLHSCDPNAGRRLVRWVRREVQQMQRKLVKLEHARRAPKRRSLGKQVVRARGQLERQLEKARRAGKLSEGCSRQSLEILATAHAGMDTIRAQQDGP
jgi:hypothetical protein